MKRLFIILIFIIPTTFLQAQNWPAAGLKVLDEQKTDVKTVLKLENNKNQSFRLTFANSPTKKEIKILKSLTTRFYSMKILSVKELSFLISNGGIDILLRPNKLSCGTLDVTPYLPGGILWSRADRLEYNFRILVKNNFLRIKGVFSTEAELCSKLTDAVNNPRDYARRRDPEFILKELARLGQSIEKLNLSVKQLKKQNSRLLYAVTTLHNSGLFSGPTKPDKKALKRLLALKRQNPKLTREQAATTLGKEKLNLSSKVINLVFILYFNQ